MDAKQVWRAALGELQVSLSPANFETWLRDTVLVDVDENRFRIAVPNGFTKDWQETRYRSLISQTLARIVGYSVQVEFVVKAAGEMSVANGAAGGMVAPAAAHPVEDAPEMQLKQPHVVRLETRPDNLEGRGAVRQRQLLINSLRMRPDRIIVGEVRGEEALDMLQAMNTGHDGSLTTVHANTPRDAVSRLEVMVTLANANMHLAAIRQQIASAVHLLVQCTRLSDGTRRVTSITEVTGMEGDIMTLQDIFVFEKRGISPDGRVRGRFCATGILPKFNEKLLAAGVRLPSEIFDEMIDVEGL